MVSPIKSVRLGGKSPRVNHVFTYRRYVFMVLKNNEVDLNLVLKFKVKIFDHTVLATSDNLMRLKCGQEGHFARFFFSLLPMSLIQN